MRLIRTFLSPSNKEGRMKPKVFSYVDARAFVTDYIDHLKSNNEYSTRKFAQKLGVGSPDYVRRIIIGERKISEALTKKFCEAFQLEAVEAKFFTKLVHFTQAKNESEKKNFWDQLNAVRLKANVRTFSFEKYRFYHNWKITLLMEGLRTQWAHASTEEIASQLNVSIAEIRDHLEALETLEVLTGQEKDWKIKDPVLQSDREAQSQMIRGFHRVLMKKAVETIDELPVEKRKFYALTMALPKDQFEAAAEELFGFLETLNFKYGQSSTADAIYNMCVQFFPLHEFKK